MKRIGVIGLFMAAAALAAQAGAINIGTGLNASGGLLASGQEDMNYTITGPGVTSAHAIVYPQTMWPVGSPWVPEQSGGQWIEPGPLDGSGYGDQQEGLFTYTLNISAPNGGTLNGEFSSDNPGALFLNGTQITQGNGWPNSDDNDYTRFIGFNNIPLADGLNSIVFEVYNAPGGYPGNPTGLIVVGTATVVPDGGLTVALLGGALIGLQALRRKLSV